MLHLVAAGKVKNTTEVFSPTQDGMESSGVQVVCPTRCDVAAELGGSQYPPSMLGAKTMYTLECFPELLPKPWIPKGRCAEQ